MPTFMRKIEVDLTPVTSKTDNLPSDPASQASVETAIETYTNDIVVVLNSNSTIITKQVVFNNANTNIDLFNLFGTIKIKLYCVCNQSLVSAGGCNISLIVDSKEVIPPTDVVQLQIHEIWNDVIPTQSIERFNDAVFEYITSGTTTVTLNIETSKQVDSGILDFFLEFQKLSSDGNAIVA